MSLSSLSQLIELAPCPILSRQMLIPFRTVESVASFRTDVGALLRRYVPQIDKIPLLHFGMSFRPVWKTIQTMSFVRSLFLSCRDAPGRPLRKWARYRSAFVCLPYELANYADLTCFIHARGEQSSTGILWDKITRFRFDPMNSHTE